MKGVMKKSWMIAFTNFAAHESCCWEFIRIEMVKATTAPVIDSRIDNMIPTILSALLQGVIFLSFRVDIGNDLNEEKTDLIAE